MSDSAVRHRQRPYYAAGVLLLYVISYFVLSRAGFRRADEVNGEGFYFVAPVSPMTARFNHSCRVFYWPLLKIERLLGTGRGVASDPLRQLD